MSVLRTNGPLVSNEWRQNIFDIYGKSPTMFGLLEELLVFILVSCLVRQTGLRVHVTWLLKWLSVLHDCQDSNVATLNNYTELLTNRLTKIVITIHPRCS